MNKSLFGICILLMFSLQSLAQQTHFVFLQTETREPFYVIMGKKNYSSSAVGYIILPKLQNGEYDIRLGFPQKENSEQHYVLQVKDNEQGFLIKQFGEKGWGIFNQQSLAIQYSGSVTSQTSLLAAAAQKRAKEVADSMAMVEAAVAQKRVADSTALANQQIEVEKALAAAAETQRLAAEKQTADSLAILKQQVDKQKNASANAAQAKLAAGKQAKDSLAAVKKQQIEDQKNKTAAAAQAKLDAQKLRNDSLAQLKKDLADKKAADALAAKEKLANTPKIIVATAPTVKTTDAAIAEKARLAAETKMADSLILVKKQLQDKAAAQAAEQSRILAERKTADSLSFLAQLQAQVDARARAKKTSDSLLASKALEAPKQNLPVSGAVIVTNTQGVTISMPPTLLYQIKTDSGFLFRYSIYNGNRIDTVNAFIKSDPVDPVVQPVETVKETTLPLTTEPKKGDPKFLDIDFKQDGSQNGPVTVVPVFNKIDTVIIAPPKKFDTIKPNVTISNVVVKTPDSSNGVKGVVLANNTNCLSQADDKDFFALRKRMAAEEGSDEMILIAKKSMREKCYSTEQVRNLAVLFLNESDRYQFLDAAYPFTHDATKYDSLLDLLKEEYYINRFKAMIRH